MLFVLVKLSPTVVSRSGQLTVLPLVRIRDLLQFTVLTLLSGSGEGSSSTFHGRLRVRLPHPSSKLLSGTQVDCEECTVVLVPNQCSSLVVKLTSSIEMSSPLSLYFFEANLALRGNREPTSPDVSV